MSLVVANFTPRPLIPGTHVLFKACCALKLLPEESIKKFDLGLQSSNCQKPLGPKPPMPPSNRSLRRTRRRRRRSAAASARARAAGIGRRRTRVGDRCRLLRRFCPADGRGALDHLRAFDDRGVDSSSGDSSQVSALNRSSGAEPHPAPIAKSREMVERERKDFDDAIFLGRSVMRSSLKMESNASGSGESEEAVPISCGAWQQQRPCPHRPQLPDPLPLSGERANSNCRRDKAISRERCECHSVPPLAHPPWAQSVSAMPSWAPLQNPVRSMARSFHTRPTTGNVTQPACARTPMVRASLAAYERVANPKGAPQNSLNVAFSVASPWHGP